MFTVPYSTDTLKAPDEIIPGNSVADAPVEYDIAPAWGADLARLKSIVIASTGLTSDDTWTPQLQESVIKAFETGARAFVNTVPAIRNLYVPARMALRAGVIGRLSPGMNLDSQVPVINGTQFSAIAGAVAGQAFWLAMKIISLSNQQEVDPRFFEQPSGSGGPGTSAATTTTAGSARNGSRRRGTAAKQGKTGSRQPGT